MTLRDSGLDEALRALDHAQAVLDAAVTACVREMESAFQEYLSAWFAADPRLLCVELHWHLHDVGERPWSTRCGVLERERGGRSFGVQPETRRDFVANARRFVVLTMHDEGLGGSRFLRRDGDHVRFVDPLLEPSLDDGLASRWMRTGGRQERPSHDPRRPDELIFSEPLHVSKRSLVDEILRHTSPLPTRIGPISRDGDADGAWLRAAIGEDAISVAVASFVTTTEDAWRAYVERLFVVAPDLDALVVIGRHGRYNDNWYDPDEVCVLVDGPERLGGAGQRFGLRGLVEYTDAAAVAALGLDRPRRACASAVEVVKLTERFSRFFRHRFGASWDLAVVRDGESLRSTVGPAVLGTRGPR